MALYLASCAEDDRHLAPPTARMSIFCPRLAVAAAS